jgi:hypothetical protein
MEQGPDELREEPDERAEDLEDLTDRPLDDRPDERGAQQSEDLSTVDPGL